jgi:hypothetical protein
MNVFCSFDHVFPLLMMKLLTVGAQKIFRRLPAVTSLVSIASATLHMRQAASVASLQTNANNSIHYQDNLPDILFLQVVEFLTEYAVARTTHGVGIKLHW